MMILSQYRRHGTSSTMILHILNRRRGTVYTQASDDTWNPVHLVYGSTYRYVTVRTGMYSSTVHTGTYFWKISHGGTYWYVLVQTNDQKYVPVRTSTYFRQYKAVHVRTRQFMEVQGST